MSIRRKEIQFYTSPFLLNLATPNITTNHTNEPTSAIAVSFCNSKTNPTNTRNTKTM